MSKSKDLEKDENDKEVGSKVSWAQAARDVVIYVLGHGKTWQFLVPIAALWTYQKVSLPDVKEAARFLLQNTWFGWGGWAAAFLIATISTIYVRRSQRVVQQYRTELQAEQSNRKLLIPKQRLKPPV